jgi:hypothetical protein
MRSKVRDFYGKSALLFVMAIAPRVILSQIFIFTLTYFRVNICDRESQRLHSQLRSAVG